MDTQYVHYHGAPTLDPQLSSDNYDLDGNGDQERIATQEHVDSAQGFEQQPRQHFLNTVDMPGKGFPHLCANREHGSSFYKLCNGFDRDDLFPEEPQNSVLIWPQDFRHDYDIFGEMESPATWLSDPSSSLSDCESIFPAPNVGGQYPQGYIRPCSHLTPMRDAMDGHVSEADLDSERRVSEAAEQARSDRPKRARHAATKRCAKSAKTVDSGLHSTGTAQADRDIAKRLKESYQERNRVAAVKCRAKRMKFNKMIEEKHLNHKVLNLTLKQQISDMRGELASLRMRALGHHGCNCQVTEYNLLQAGKLAMCLDFVVSPPHVDRLGLRQPSSGQEG